MPKIMKNSSKVREYKASKLVHLLLHEKKTAERLPQINAIVQKKDREKKKRRKDA